MCMADSSEDVWIETRRLLLRDFRADDWPDAHAYRSDPEVARFMLTHRPESPEQTRAWLDQVIAETREQWRTRRTLAIVLQAEDRVIGEISIGPSPDDFPGDGEVGFGYMLNREDWGQG